MRAKGTPTADQLYRQDKLYKLINEINNHLEAFAKYEDRLLKDKFEDFYKDVYVATGRTEMPVVIDEMKVKRAVLNAWATDGKSFSDRIWTHKAALVEKLEDGLVNTLTTGKNWSVIVKELHNTFGVSFYNARRLVRTELQHIMLESTLDKYRFEGVEEVIWIEQDDCCKICKPYSGQKYPIDSCPGLLHPNCRASVIAVVNLPESISTPAEID